MATVEQPTSSAPLDPRELRAWRGLLRAHASMCKALDAELEAAHGLPLLSRSGLTRLIDRLQRDGLVERQSCGSDARGSYAVLTDEGARTLAEARATHLAGVRRLFLDRFTPEEQALLGNAWERVLPGAGAPAAGGAPDDDCC